MGPVYRVSSLESNNAAPALLGKDSANLRWCSSILLKRRVQRMIYQSYRPTQQDLSLAIESTHTRMRLFCSQIDSFCFALFVVRILLFQFQDAKQMIFSLIESYTISLAIALCLSRFYRQCYRYSP